MFTIICAATFVLVAAFVLYCYGMYLIYLLWNNKYARKARKDAIEAIVNLNEFLRKYNY